MTIYTYVCKHYQDGCDKSEKSEACIKIIHDSDDPMLSTTDDDSPNCYEDKE